MELNVCTLEMMLTVRHSEKSLNIEFHFRECFSFNFIFRLTFQQDILLNYDFFPNATLYHDRRYETMIKTAFFLFSNRT